MSRKTKLILYVVLGVAAAGFLAGFYANYRAALRTADKRAADPEVEGLRPTNSTATETNLTAATNSVPATNSPVAIDATTRNRSGMMMYGFLLFGATVGLALLGANDISHWFANRAEDLIFNDEGTGIKNPEYEHAQQVWADGKPLEAIQLMREYLKRHPREQFVALHIAEIYENDLKNYVAAALEYEQIIQHKLPPERWGWAAIHLANLYSGKLNKMQPAIELLQRIERDYGQTAAAKKARERLAEAGVAVEDPASAEKADSHLPPGFSPRKP